MEEKLKCCEIVRSRPVHVRQFQHNCGIIVVSYSNVKAHDVPIRLGSADELNSPILT